MSTWLLAGLLMGAWALGVLTCWTLVRAARRGEACFDDLGRERVGERSPLIGVSSRAPVEVERKPGGGFVARGDVR